MARGYYLLKRVSIALFVSFLMVMVPYLFAENALAADTEGPVIVNINLWNKDGGNRDGFSSYHLVYHDDTVLVSIEAIDESGLQEDGCSLSINTASGVKDYPLTYDSEDGLYKCEIPITLDTFNADKSYSITGLNIYDKNGIAVDKSQTSYRTIFVQHEWNYDERFYTKGECGGNNIWYVNKCKRCGAESSEYKNFMDSHLWTNLVITKEPTCTQDGSKRYKCPNHPTLTGLGTIDALGHKWSQPEYTWSDDYSTVTAYHKCVRDGCAEENGGEPVEETLVVQTTKTEVEATTASRGLITYTATFERYTGFYTQKKVILIPKLPSDDDEGSGNSGDTGASGTGGETGAASSAEDLQLGTDGTAFGAGASAAAVETALSAMKNDNDPAGTKMNKIRLRSKKQTKKSVTLKWTKVKGAAKYVVYGNRCGKSRKLTKVAEVTKTSKKVTKAAGKKIKKGKYYKFVVVAYDKNNKVITASKVIHVATRGGKIGNHKKIKISKSVIKKAKKLKKGKTLKLKAKAVAKYKSKKVKKHVGIRYESTNTKVAKVTKKGKVKAVGKGKCTIYVFAQNGVYKKVKVVVK